MLQVVYVTATMPYLFLTIILVRGLTLDGSLDGVLYFVRPDFQKLAKYEVWHIIIPQWICLCKFSIGQALIFLSDSENWHVENECLPANVQLTSFSASGYIFSKSV